MLSASFTGFKSPLLGACARLVSGELFESQYFKPINKPRESFCIVVGHTRGIASLGSPQVSNFTHELKHWRACSSSLELSVGLPTSCHKFNVVSRSVTAPWYHVRALGASSVSARLKPPKTVFNKAYSTNKPNSDADTTKRQPPPKELRTHIEAFFANYPGFEYNPSKPCMDEFKRLKEWVGWRKKSDEFEEARKGMNEALTEQFNAIYGKDPDDIAAWRNLCSVLNLAEIPTEISGCKKLIKSLYINIIDLVDQPVADIRVGYFRTEHELARYTWKHEKFYRLESAKAGGLLKHLLRFIEQPRRKSLSNPKLRKA